MFLSYIALGLFSVLSFANVGMVMNTNVSISSLQHPKDKSPGEPDS